MITFGAPLMVFGYIGHKRLDCHGGCFCTSNAGREDAWSVRVRRRLCAALTMVATSISQVFLPRICYAVRLIKAKYRDLLELLS